MTDLNALKTSIKQQEGKYNWFGHLRGSSGALTKSLDQAWKIWDAVSEAPLGRDFLMLNSARCMPRSRCQARTSRNRSYSRRPTTGCLHGDENPFDGRGKKKDTQVQRGRPGRQRRSLHYFQTWTRAEDWISYFRTLASIIECIRKMNQLRRLLS